MKLIRDFIFAALSSSIGITLAMTPHGWFLAPLITVLVTYFTTSVAEAFYTAFFVGLLTDLYTLSIGPNIIVFCAVVLAVHYLMKVMASSQSAVSIVTAVLGGVTLYYVLYVGIQSIRIGGHYVHAVVSGGWFLLFYILLSSFITLCILAVVSLIKKLLTDHAR